MHKRLDGFKFQPAPTPKLAAIKRLKCMPPRCLPRIYIGNIVEKSLNCKNVQQTDKVIEELCLYKFLTPGVVCPCPGLYTCTCR